MGKSTCSREAYRLIENGHCATKILKMSNQAQMNSIGSIPAHVTKLMNAVSERAATESQIAYVVAGKQLQASRQTGQAAVELLTAAVDIQAQLSQNRLDVRA